MDIEAYLKDLRERQARTRPVGAAAEVTFPLGEMTLPGHVAHWAALHPDRLALAFHGPAPRTYTYAQLDEESGRLAGWLAGPGGVRPGDRVAVHLGNSPEYVVSLLAVLRAGAVLVPVNPMFERRELAHELADSGAVTVITRDDLADRVQDVREETAVRQVLTVPGIWEEALRYDTSPRAELPRHAAGMDDLAVLNYTGGTTGLPKGCEHTHRHMIYTFAAVASATGRGPDSPSTALCYIPVFWIAGENTAFAPFVTGGTTVLLPRWDAGAVLSAIRTYRPTTMVGTVENYLELLDHPALPGTGLSSLTDPLAVSFVRTLTPEVRQRWQKAAGRKSVLREGGYGMTETHTSDVTPFGLSQDDRDLRARPVFCGLPVPGTDVAVVSFATGEPLPLGETGEIVVRGPSVMRGYRNSPEATARQLRDGWLHTGDNGVLDEDGCLHFLGRDKDMIKVKGMSVFPAEVEMLLAQHPEVLASAVVAAADPELGQRPVAFVRRSPGAAVDAEGLAEWARTSMARYKVPLIALTDAFPMTATGKIRKVELADHAQRLLDGEREGGASRA